MSYSAFAKYYDKLMDFDYKSGAEYILSLFRRFGKTPTLLLDLACGTGGFTLEFARRGIEVIGVDISEDMLSRASQKAADEGLYPLFLCQNAAKLDLYGTVDGAVCCLDSLNHIIDENELLRAFSRVSLFCERGALFIFDLNTVYKHEKILGDETFIIEREDIFCCWRNSFDKKSGVTDMRLDFFSRNGGLYERQSEQISERAYKDEFIFAALQAAGFRVEAVFSWGSESPPKPDCERTAWIARKI